MIAEPVSLVKDGLRRARSGPGGPGGRCLSACRHSVVAVVKHSVVAVVNGLYRQSWGVASSGRFLLLGPFPPGARPARQGLFSPRKVGPQLRVCFCFYGAAGWGQPGAGGEAAPSEAQRPALKPWFPLIKRCFRGDDALQIPPIPGPSWGGALLAACSPGFPRARPRAHRPSQAPGGQALTSREHTRGKNVVHHSNTRYFLVGRTSVS